MEADSYEEALAVVQDVHHWALIVAHLLEDHLEWLSYCSRQRSPRIWDTHLNSIRATLHVSHMAANSDIQIFQYFTS